MNTELKTLRSPLNIDLQWKDLEKEEPKKKGTFSEYYDLLRWYRGTTEEKGSSKKFCAVIVHVSMQNILEEKRPL